MGVKIHSLDVTNHLVELERDTWYGLKKGNLSYGLEIYSN